MSQTSNLRPPRVEPLPRLRGPPQNCPQILVAAFYPKARLEASERHRGEALEEFWRYREERGFAKSNLGRGILTGALDLLREEDAWVAVRGGG